MIVSKKLGLAALPDRDDLWYSWQGNPDGAGYAYARFDGKVVFKKGFFSFDSLMRSMEQEDFWKNPRDYAFVIHFRLATHGGRSAGHLHPFPLDGQDIRTTEGETDCAFFHNGCLSSGHHYVEDGSDSSDTMLFVEQNCGIKNLQDGGRLQEAVWNPYVNMLIGEDITWNRFVFLYENGALCYVNKHKGGDDPNGIWYSNRIH